MAHQYLVKIFHDTCKNLPPPSPPLLPPSYILNVRSLTSKKNVSQVVSKNFATQCFFSDHLKHEIVNKTTCRVPSRNPRQL